MSIRQACEIDVPNEPTDYYRCLDRKLRTRWPGMTAVRMRLLQATAISLLIGALAYSLEASVTFAIGAVVVTNLVLLGDIAAVAEVKLSTGGLQITMQDDEIDDSEDDQ